MEKMRVHELAKKLNITSKEVLSKLAELGFQAKSHTSSVEEKIANKLLKKAPKQKKPAVKKAKEKIKTTRVTKAKTVKKPAQRKPKKTVKQEEKAPPEVKVDKKIGKEVEKEKIKKELTHA